MEKRVTRTRISPSLYQHTTAAGSVSYSFKYTWHGRVREMGLGSASTQTLAAVRSKVAALQELLSRGLDPLEYRGDDGQTFADAVRAFAASRRPRWSARHSALWISAMERHALPALGALPVAEVTAAAVRPVMEAVAAEHPETAKRLGGRISAVLAWCAACGEPNVAPLALRGILPPHRWEPRPAMPYTDLPELVAALLHEPPGSPSAGLAFVIATATRRAEVHGMTWAELALADRQWIIPETRTKVRRVHRVPLSELALRCLPPMPPRCDGGGPHASVWSWGPEAMRRTLRRHHPTATVHGMRSAFRDWCAERTSTPWEVAEAALEHRLGSDTERRYLRSDLFDRRIILMRAWGTFLAG